MATQEINKKDILDKVKDILNRKDSVKEKN